MKTPPTPAGPDFVAMAVRALTLYSLAEFQSGHARSIQINASGRSFSLADDGRGHAIHKTIDGHPYLQFIYTQLDYPFAAGGGSVQLQGIGMSMLNSLCKELRVKVRRFTGSLDLLYRDGALCEERLTLEENPRTGNAISGHFSHALQISDTDETALTLWLQQVLRASPGLQLVFNGLDITQPAGMPLR